MYFLCKGDKEEREGVINANSQQKPNKGINQMNNVNPEQPFEPTAELWLILYKTKDNIFHLKDKNGKVLLSGEGSNMLEWIFNKHKDEKRGSLDMVLQTVDEHLDMVFDREHNIYAGFISINPKEADNET